MKVLFIEINTFIASIYSPKGKLSDLVFIIQLNQNPLHSNV